MIPISDQRWLKARAQVFARSGSRPVGLLLAVQLDEPPAEEPVTGQLMPPTAAIEVLLAYDDAGRAVTAVESEVPVEVQGSNADGDPASITLSRGGAFAEMPYPDAPNIELAFDAEEARRLAEALRAAIAHRRYLGEAELSWDAEIDELLADFGERPPAPEGEIERIRERWRSIPDDYLDVLRRKNGGEGSLTESYLVLRPVEELEEENDDLAEVDHLRDLIIVGGDGGGEAIGYDVANQRWVMAPFIGDRNDFFVLGGTFLDALRKVDSGPWD